MKPKLGRSRPIEGHAFKWWAFLTAFSNVVNLICRGDRRERKISRFGVKELLVQRDELLKPVSSWLIQELPQHSGSKDALETYLVKVKALSTTLASYLSGDKQVVPSFGDWLRDRIMTDASSSAGRIIGISSPEAGVGRPYYVATSVNFQPKSVGWVPDPGHALCDEIARVLGHFDTPIFSTKLVNTTASLENGLFDVKDRVTGEPIVAIERAKRPYTLALLYQTQGTLLCMHAIWPILTLALEIDALTSEEGVRDLEKHRSWEKRLNTFQMHPLVSLITSGFTKVSSKHTLFGERSPIFLDPYGILAPKGVDATGREWKPEKTLHELAKELHRQLLTTEESTEEVNHSLRWGEWASKSRMVGIYAMIAKMESLFGLKADIPQVINALHWNKLDGGTHELIYTGGDFIQTSGTMYTENAATGLFGMKPVIGSGNRLATIDDRRDKSDWNIHGESAGASRLSKGKETSRKRYRLGYSIMHVMGSQTWGGSTSLPTSNGKVGTPDGSEIERFYIPGSQFQGMDGAEEVFLGLTTDDPMAKLALEYYTKQGAIVEVAGVTGEPMLIEEYFNELTQTTQEHSYITDWSPLGVKEGDPDGKSSFSSLVASFVENGSKSVVPVREAKMYTISRERGGWFPVAFPVKMAMNQVLVHYSKLGELEAIEKQDGHVDYMGELDMSAGTASILETICTLNHAEDRSEILQPVKPL